MSKVKVKAGVETLKVEVDEKVCEIDIYENCVTDYGNEDEKYNVEGLTDALYGFMESVLHWS